MSTQPRLTCQVLQSLRADYSGERLDVCGEAVVLRRS